MNITWHELRCLVIWAERWASHAEASDRAMMLASCRKGFDSNLFLGPLLIRDRGALVPLIETAEKLRGKRVCILVHGYHVDLDNAVAAYSVIEKRAPAYDEIIGFLWPGSAIALGFFPAISRATESGALLKQLLSALEDVGALVTVETHSLGARVALQALKLGGTCRELILTAPAVDDGVLAPGGEFSATVPRAARIAVLYSQNDPVLKGAYFGAELILEWHKVHALGLDGPEHPAPYNVYPYDLSDQIHGHSEYKDCQAAYDIWQETINPKGI